MESEVICLIINAALFCMFATYCIKKYGLSYKSVPSIMWALSSIVSILYFTHPFRPSTVIFRDQITIIPLLYLFLMVLISFIPLLIFENQKINYVIVNQKFYNFLCIVIIALSIIPLYPNIKYFVNNMFRADAFIDTYNDKMAGYKINVLTGIPETCMRWVKYLRGIIPILFFVSFSKYVKINYFIRVGLTLSMINISINFLNFASRFALMTDVLYLAFVYLLFSSINSFTDKISKIIKKVFVFTGCLFSLGIITITLQRFSEDMNAKGIDYTLELYMGEGMCNFSGDMWNMPNTTDGANCFGAFISKWNGMDNIGRNYLHLEGIVHRRMNVFYTFIGDYYTDFGRYLTVLFVILITIITSILTKCYKTISLKPIIILAMYVKVLIIGITYWTYLNYTFEIIGSLVTAIAFSIISRNKITQRI